MFKVSYASLVEDDNVLEVNTIYQKSSIEIKETDYGKVEPVLVNISTHQQRKLPAFCIDSPSYSVDKKCQFVVLSNLTGPKSC